MYENNKTNYAAAKHEKIREPFNAIRLEFQRQYENFFQESEAIDQGIERLSTELSCAQVEESRLRESFYSDEVDPQKSELLQRSKEQEGYEEERVHLPQVLASKEQRALRPENNYELFEEEVRKKETAAQQELVRLHNVKERVDVVRRYKKLIDEKSTSIGLKIALAMGIAPEIDDLRRDDQQCEKRLPTGECFIHSYIPQGNIRKRMALQEAAQQRQIQGVLNSFNPMARHLLQQHIRAQQRMTRS